MELHTPFTGVFVIHEKFTQYYLFTGLCIKKIELYQSHFIRIGIVQHVYGTAIHRGGNKPSTQRGDLCCLPVNNTAVEECKLSVRAYIIDRRGNGPLLQGIYIEDIADKAAIYPVIP